MEEKDIEVDTHYNPGFKFGERPTAFYLEINGVLKRIPIDKVYGEVKAASLRLGKAGIRYTCVVRGKELYLYKEGSRWHIESSAG